MHTSLTQKYSYRQRVLLLIFIFSIIRLLYAFFTDLGNDEAYYWLYSQHLQWNYFDHPPMVALWIRAFTFNLFFQQEGFLRLASVVSCAIATWFMYKTVSVIHSERAGWFAACLYNASFYAGITAGIYIMPDTPQMVFWTLSLWMIARICKNENSWFNWIGFGIATGLCIMSKIHGTFIWIGLFSFALFLHPKWLTKPQFYIALLLTFCIASPILIWNVQNHFITYRYHGSRITIHSVNTYSFFRELTNQIFFNNFLNVALIVAAIFSWKKMKAIQQTALSIYSLIGIPLILFLLFISVFRNTLPHWSGPAYVSLLPLASIYLAEKKPLIFFPKILKWSLAVFILALICWMTMVEFYPGTLGSKNQNDLGRDDLSLDMFGWPEAGKKFDVFYQNEIKNGSTTSETPVVCFYWWGAHVEYYFCRPANIQMIGLGPIMNIHHYYWMNALRKNKVNMNTAYCIIPSDEGNYISKEYWQFYKSIQLATVIKTFRNGKPAHDFFVYRLSGWKGNF